MNVLSFVRKVPPVIPPCYTAIKQGKSLSFIVPYSDRETFQGMALFPWMMPTGDR